MANPLMPSPRTQSHLLLLFVLALLFGAVEVPMPIGPDQGILCYVARDILRGGVPYLTSWDHKPPGAHYLLALGFWFLGEGPTPLRLFDLVYVFLIAAAAWRIGVQLFSTGAGLWAGILFLITYYTRTDWWNKCQPDQYMLLPLLLSLVVVLGDPAGTRTWTCLLAGLCLGAAFLVKFVALAAVVPILFCYLRQVSLRQQPRRVLKDVGLFLSGFMVPNLLLGAWLWWTGALGGFVEALFVFNYHYSQLGRQPPWKILPQLQPVWLLVVLALLPLVTVAATVVAAAWRPRLAGVCGELVSPLRSGMWGVGFAGLLLLALVLEVFVQGKLFLYHLVPVFLALCLLAGLGLHLVGRAARMAAVRLAPVRLAPVRLAPGLERLALLPAAVLVLGYFLPVAGPQAYKLVAACGLLDGGVDRDRYYRDVGGYSDGTTFSYLASRRVAGHVREGTGPQEPVYVWGFDPVVNVLAGRRMPTRFSYNTPLVVPWRKPQWRREFLADLERDPPRYLVVLTRDPHPWTTGREQDSYQLMTGDFPALARFVADHYRLETTIQSYWIYRRL